MEVGTLQFGGPVIDWTVDVDDGMGNIIGQNTYKGLNPSYCVMGERCEFNINGLLLKPTNRIVIL